MRKFFFLASISILFHSLSAKAQIVYTDVNPDSTVNEFLQAYGVDFNHDDKIDVHLALLDNVGVWVMLLIPDDDNDEVFVVYDGEEASVLEYGDEISSSSQFFQLGSGGWGGLLYGYWENDGEYGNWVDVQENKYLGIRFNDGASNYYAWIYLSTIVHNYDDMEFTIQSFAYNSTAEEGISAGDTGQNVGFSSFNDARFSFYPNPAKDCITLDGYLGIENVFINDITGNMVLSDQTISSNKLDISTLSSGVYILSAQINGHIIKRKFIKE
jgi:hypothetical protein